MHLAPQIHTLRRASRAVLPVIRHQETLSQRCRVMHVIDILPGRERKSTFRAWPEIDIPRRYRKLTFLNMADTYVRTYIAKLIPHLKPCANALGNYC